MKSTATDTSIERPVGEAGLGGASLPYDIVARDRQASRAVSVQAANVRRNAGGGTWARRLRWRRAREACWALLEQHVTAGARVAVVGAGNGDDLSLARLARRAGALDLIDLDGGALRRARRRCALTRTPVGVLVDDVSGGVADRIVAGALGESVDVPTPPRAPVGGGPYDVVIADLVATQLLYPALVDTGLPAAHTTQRCWPTARASPKPSRRACTRRPPAGSSSIYMTSTAGGMGMTSHSRSMPSSSWPRPTPRQR
jgi:hypothetical protein